MRVGCLLFSCILLYLSAPGSTPLARGLQAQNSPRSAPPRVDPKAQLVLDKAIQALGGTNFLAIKTLTTRGRAYAISKGETSGLAPFESVVEYPDKRRFSYGEKKPVILINNGDQAWEVDRYGVIRQTAEQARRWQFSNRYSLENLLRLRIHEPGWLVQDGGEDFVDSVAVYVLDLFDTNGVHLKLYVQKSTFLPARISYRVQDPDTREWDEYSDAYGDYQKVQEILTPMHIARFLNGERVSELFRSFALYNRPLPPSTFQPSG